MPAAPGFITWGVPLVMAVLLLALMVSQWERLNFFGRIQGETGAAISWLRAWGESLDPQIVVAPVAGSPEQVFVASGLTASARDAVMAEAVEPQVEIMPGAALNAIPPVTATLAPTTNTQIITPAVALAVALIPTDTPLPTSLPTETPLPPPTETPVSTLTPTATPTPVPSATPTNTPTQSPTVASLTATASATKAGVGVEATKVITETAGVTTTVAATATPGASLLPSPTPTTAPAIVLPTATPTLELALATATPVVYVVQAGDTTMGIALRFRVSVEELIAANGFSAQEARLLRPGQQLVIPIAETVQPAAAAPTPTAAVEVAAARYTVRSGDTIIAIASRMGATVEGILAANGMTEADARAIRPGDELLIPAPGAVIAPPTATPTATPPGEPSLTPTQTPTRLPPTFTPTATPVALRLAAPVLLSPESGAAASCAGADKLVWSPVQFVKDADRYRLNLGYVSGRDAAGNSTVTWVIQQLQPPGLTQWNMDGSLCGLAPQELGRQWRWYVDVVEIVNGAALPVSPPSEIWGFSWN